MRRVYSDGDLPPESPGTRCTVEEGKTRQSDAETADINLTIKKYNLQPFELEMGWSGREGMFGDLTMVPPDFQAAWNQIRAAEEAFMGLPPEVRLKFDNEPVKLLDAWLKGEMAEVFEEIGWLERLAVPPADAGGVKPVSEEQRRTPDGRFTFDEAPPGGAQ